MMKKIQKIFFVWLMCFALKTTAQISPDKKWRVLISDSSVTMFDNVSNKIIWKKDANNWETSKLNIIPNFNIPKFSHTQFLQKSNCILISGMDNTARKNASLIFQKANAMTDSIKNNINIKTEDKVKKIYELSVKAMQEGYVQNAAMHQFYYLIFDLNDGSLKSHYSITDNSQEGTPINGEYLYSDSDESFMVLNYFRYPKGKIRVIDINTGTELNTLDIPQLAYRNYCSFMDDNKNMIIYKTDFEKENSLVFLDYTNGNQKIIELTGCPLPGVYHKESVEFKGDFLYYICNDGGFIEDASKDYTAKININSGQLTEKLNFTLIDVSLKGDKVVYKKNKEIIYEFLNGGRKIILKDIPESCFSIELDSEGEIVTFSFFEDDTFILKRGEYDFKKSENVIWINN
jgi:hypothetical protein